MLDSQNKERRRQNRSVLSSKVRISTVPAVSVAGRYEPIWLIWPDSGRISPVRRESKPNRRESSRVGANPN